MAEGAAEGFLVLGQVVVEQGGVEVGEPFELLALDGLADQALDGLGVIDLVAGEQGEGIPFLAGAAGTADAVGGSRS